jgi:hypothetical protein
MRVRADEPRLRGTAEDEAFAATCLAEPLARVVYVGAERSSEPAGEVFYGGGMLRR